MPLELPRTAIVAWEPRIRQASPQPSSRRVRSCRLCAPHATAEQAVLCSPAVWEADCLPGCMGAPTPRASSFWERARELLPPWTGHPAQTYPRQTLIHPSLLLAHTTRTPHPPPLT